MTKELTSGENPTRTKNKKQQQTKTVKRVRAKDHQKDPPAPNTRVRVS
jgi:hypothetical protein